jgi:hypothetical protein
MYLCGNGFRLFAIQNVFSFPFAIAFPAEGGIMVPSRQRHKETKMRFDELAIGAQFMFEGQVFTKKSDLLARSDNGDWVASDRLQNPLAESEFVELCD